MTASNAPLPRTPALPPSAWVRLVTAALALGILADLLFNGTDALGINAPLWLAALFTAFLLVTRRSTRPIGRIPAVLFAASLLLATMITWRGAQELQSFLLLASMGALLLGVAIDERPTTRRPSITLLVGTAVVSAIAALRGMFEVVASAPWQARLDPNHRDRANALLRALLLAAPLLFVFGALFVAADAVLETWVHDTFALDLGAVGRHLAWIIAGSIAAAAFLSTGLDAGIEIPEDPALPEARRLRTLETAIVLGSLALLFGLFVLIQLRYLFGGDEHVQTSTGLTYAEYARRGFFELVIVAALLLPVLLAFDSAREHTPRSRTAFRVLAALLVILLVVIVASAFERLRIYIDAYGLTTLRLYVASFLAALTVVFAALLWAILRERRDHFVVATIATALVALALLVTSNPHDTVASTNLARAEDGHDFDTAHALLLGADATPTLVTGLEVLSAVDACEVATTLLDRWGDGEPEVRSWNWARAAARSTVDANRTELESACQ